MKSRMPESQQSWIRARGPPLDRRRWFHKACQLGGSRSRCSNKRAKVSTMREVLSKNFRSAGPKLHSAIASEMRAQGMGGVRDEGMQLDLSVTRARGEPKGRDCVRTAETSLGRWEPWDEGASNCATVNTINRQRACASCTDAHINAEVRESFHGNLHALQQRAK